MDANQISRFNNFLGLYNHSLNVTYFQIVFLLHTDAVAQRMSIVNNGSSLLNSNLNNLQAPLYTVRCSIAVENFTKWPLLLKECQIEHGSVNVPPRNVLPGICLLYTSPSPRDATLSRMPSSA